MTLDVRSKILLLLFANMTFLFRVQGWVEYSIVGGFFLLLLFLDRKKQLVTYGLLFLATFLLEASGLALALYDIIPVIGNLMVIIRLGLPSFMAGSLLLGTTSSYDLVHALRKWRVPESLLLTLAVMQRFLPAIREDSVKIHQALQVRGIFLGKRDLLFHPFRYGEYLLIPLLMSLMRTAQDLTIASLTKGLALDKKVEESFPSRFKLADWSVCLWMLIMTGLIL